MKKLPLIGWLLYAQCLFYITSDPYSKGVKEGFTKELLIIKFSLHCSLSRKQKLC